MNLRIMIMMSHLTGIATLTGAVSFRILLCGIVIVSVCFNLCSPVA